LLKAVGLKDKFYTLTLLLLWHFPQFSGLLSVGKDALLALFVSVIKRGTKDTALFKPKADDSLGLRS
jgi:hypothetical protein